MKRRRLDLVVFRLPVAVSVDHGWIGEEPFDWFRSAALVAAEA